MLHPVEVHATRSPLEESNHHTAAPPDTIATAQSVRQRTRLKDGKRQTPGHHPTKTSVLTRPCMRYATMRVELQSGTSFAW
jgi:hypothetical protein